MIWCVWYPSGGFGHFINAVITLRGVGFARPHQQDLRLSSTGNSHSLELVAPKYLHDPSNYKFDFDPAQNYAVLIDNGINSQSDRFIQVFPDARIIRICYSDRTWPVVAQTMIVKAMNKNLRNHLHTEDWGHNADWAQKEKFFLFLRDHDLRSSWRVDSRCTVNIDVEHLMTYNLMKSYIMAAGIEIAPFEDLWAKWHDSNARYFEPVQQAQKIIHWVQQRQEHDISHISDLWTQAVIYYYVWLEYRFEIPHNDYSNWFTSTGDIVTMLKKHGVIS